MSKASLFQFLASGNSDWAGAIVGFYEPDGSTLKNVYTTPDYTDTTGYSANPTIMSSSGRIVLYGSGRYTVKISTSTGANINTFQNVDQIQSLRNEINLTSYGYNKVALDTAVLSAGGDAKTLVITGDTNVTIENEATIPSNITLLFDAGSSAKFDIAAGKILHINGEVIAPKREIFTGGAGASVRLYHSGDNVPYDIWGSIINTNYFPVISSRFNDPGIRESNAAIYGNPSGGFMGNGTVNAENGVYDDGTQLLDKVFEYVYLGAPKDDNDKDYKLKSLQEEIDFTKKHLHLSTIIGRESFQRRKPSLGELTNQLWETVESQFIYISELHKRIEALEND
tara:strand:- start:13477 stop:14496 length:1020 start_codon:yes stop_codon:yes gene_type:complete